MPHWHCHASNYQQLLTTNSSVGYKALQLCLSLHMRSTGAFPSSRDSTKKPKNNRCTVPSICPHTNKQVYCSSHLSTYQCTGVTFQPSAHVLIHRCAAPSICPQNIPANVFVLVLLLKTKFRDEKLEHILGNMFREKVCSISRTRNLL